MSDIVVVDSGQTYESTESSIVAKNEADRAEQWAKYSEEKANLSEQSALEAAQLKDDAKAQADRAQNISDAFDTNSQEKTQEFNQNASDKTNTYNSNAQQKLDAYNANDTAKTQAFNTNAAQKQAAVDASAENARKWAVGTKKEQPEGSSRYWAEEAAKSAASVDANKIKKIAYDRGYNPGSVSGNFTAVLQDWHERFSIPVADNVTITIDTSQLTFPEEWYTMVFEIYFLNGAKTVNLSYAGGIRWVNGLTPDFTNGRSHLVALTKHRSWSDVAMSDAGSLGG